MKTLNFKSQLVILAMLSFCFFTASCSGGSEDEIDIPPSGDVNTPGDGEDNEGGSNDDNNNPGGTGSGSVMSPLQQKEKLDEIACDFLEQIPSSDFQDLKWNLEDLEMGYYLNDYSWENVENWAQNLLEDCIESLGTTTEESEYHMWGGYTNYIYTNYKAILLPANFTGKFTARNGKWTRSNANNLQFEIPEKNCVLTLTTSGDVKKVYAFNLDEWQDYGYDYENGGYVEYEYYDRMQCTIGVPEKITVTLKVNGETLISTNISIDLSNITGEKFDIARSAISASATTELNNGYKFNFSECKYTGNNNVAAKASVSKNAKTLIAMTLSSKVENIPSYNITDSDIDSDQFEDSNAKDAYAKFDILGRLQFAGKIADVRRFAKYLNSADENDDNETNYRSYINQANALMDVNMYFDNTSTKQATVKLEPFQEDDWYGSRYWESEPVIYFQDGTSYSTFEAFFDADDFGNTVNAFEKLIERYRNMLED